MSSQGTRSNVGRDSLGRAATAARVFWGQGRGAQAAELGLLLVAPDTSPRHLGLPGETESWDFGAGASFYFYLLCGYHSGALAGSLPDYSYVTQAHFPADPNRQGIFGHSMGGHGALVCALRNPTPYRLVSAFASIAAPMQWGQKAFTGYLGSNRESWKAYDAS